MPILPDHADSIRVASKVLRDGGLVGMPTETVYGLAADARRPDAIAQVFHRKGRPLFDPLIVHVAPGPLEACLDGWVHPDVIPLLSPWIGAFWPGPLTLVLPRDPSVHDLITAGLDTVAVRMPAHPVAQELIRAAGPVVAPSANRFGRISPTTAQAVLDELGDLVVLDGGPCQVGIESTILQVDAGSYTVLRPGGTPSEALAAVLGPLRGALHSPERPTSPGQLPSHYAPRTPITLVPDWRALPVPTGSFAVLDHDGSRCPFPGAQATHTLPTSPILAAQQLFAALRALDRVGADRLLVTPFPSDDGLGSAINDRLRRAATPTSEP